MSSASLDLPIDLRKIGILHKEKIFYWDFGYPYKVFISSKGRSKDVDDILGYMLSGGQLSVMELHKVVKSLTK